MSQPKLMEISRFVGKKRQITCSKLEEKRQITRSKLEEKRQTIGNKLEKNGKAQVIICKGKRK